MIFMIVSIFACSDHETFTPFSSNGNLKSLFKEFAYLDKRNIQVDPKISNTINIDNTVVVAPSNFIWNGQDEIFNDLCNIQYQASSETSKLIFNDIESTYQNELLDIEQIIYFDVNAENQFLKMNEDKPVSIRIAQEEAQIQNKLYQLNPELMDAWIPSGSEYFELETWSVQGLEVQGYQIQPKSFGWRAIGKPIAQNMEEVSICVELPAEYNDENTSVYAVFDHYNSVLKLDSEFKN